MANDDFCISFLSESDGDFGALEGIQFDSDLMGGYVYFWSSGYVGYQLVNYDTSEEIISDTTYKILEDEELKSNLRILLSKLETN